MYGPVAFGTSARSEVLTDCPPAGTSGSTERTGRIFFPDAHGCIRMRNGDILRLSRLMPVGTPITIR
jgi:hypothetical protein